MQLRMTPNYARLCRALQYQFRDPNLLQIALTHRSVGADNNERLEFLGDAILSFVITNQLYTRFPHDDEGTLSRYRARLVKGETLAIAARVLHLGEYLRLGPGELKSGGFDRDSILANAIEAIIGAVYLDGGLEPAGALVLNMLQQPLENVSAVGGVKDPKTLLQELLQARHAPLPDYTVAKISGEPHAQSFTVTCSVEGLTRPVIGEGASRRKAEQDAAQKALKLLSG